MKGAVTLSFVFNLALFLTTILLPQTSFPDAPLISRCSVSHPLSDLSHTHTHGEEAGPSEICEYIVWNVCPS